MCDWFGIGFSVVLVMYAVWTKLVCGLCFRFCVSGILCFAGFGLIDLCFVANLVSGGSSFVIWNLVRLAVGWCGVSVVPRVVLGVFLFGVGLAFWAVVWMFWLAWCFWLVGFDVVFGVGAELCLWFWLWVVGVACFVVWWFTLVSCWGDLVVDDCGVLVLVGCLLSDLFGVGLWAWLVWCCCFDLCAVLCVFRSLG